MSAAVDQAELDRKATLETRGPVISRNLIRNLTREPGRKTLVPGSLEGVPAFVVSAGPSLDKNVGLLERCNGRGVTFAVNTALKSVHSAGQRVDYAVMLESMPLGWQLHDTAPAWGQAILDASTCPETWDSLPDAWTVAQADPATLGVVRQSRAWPVAYGNSVATLAIGIARDLGCSPIVLVGQDLAIAPDGQYYAQNSPWPEMRAEGGEWEHGPAIRIHGIEGRKPYRDKVGGPPEADYRPGELRDGWGGQKVWCLPEFVRQQEWIGRQHDQGTRVVNATEGGALLPCPNVPLAEVLEELPETGKPVPDTAQTDPAAAAEEISRQVDRVLALAHFMRTNEGSAQAFVDVLDGVGLASAPSVGERSKLMRAETTDPKMNAATALWHRIRANYELLKNGATEALEIAKP